MQAQCLIADDTTNQSNEQLCLNAAGDTYDEHGGFFDHVEPHLNRALLNDRPANTRSLAMVFRVPAVLGSRGCGGAHFKTSRHALVAKNIS